MRSDKPIQLYRKHALISKGLRLLAPIDAIANWQSETCPDFKGIESKPPSPSLLPGNLAVSYFSFSFCYTELHAQDSFPIPRRLRCLRPKAVVSRTSLFDGVQGRGPKIGVRDLGHAYRARKDSLRFGKVDPSGRRSSALSGSRPQNEAAPLWGCQTL